MRETVSDIRISLRLSAQKTHCLLLYSLEGHQVLRYFPDVLYLVFVSDCLYVGSLVKLIDPILLALDETPYELHHPFYIRRLLYNPSPVS